MKKILLSLLLVLPLALSTISCHEEPDPVVVTSPYDSFKGPWTATFSGGDTGTFDFNVKSDGSITGTIMSDSFPESDLSLVGRVSKDGDVNIRLMYTSTIDIGGFTGKMYGKTASGTWVNTSSKKSGNWIADKG
ncbi:hypothetical protein H1R17_04645 [Flavobacterium sp. xlx-214]|uniref:hypothetical protein n=1 Tax=unclassified Flavobacterium TaxID=196869 RepID=UPI0013D341B7|nr:MULTISPECIES: hypothetical protein [unclassified Flavobacterium]MBA5792182.1 hypothetical protein [Flavobacterium sp. xlx-221]QMI84426.1 hypothetical protein H1R17_04645 [Flavobacterium sp. xlx-214]